MNLQDFTRRADELIALADRLAATHRVSEWGHDWVDREIFGEFRAAGLSFLRNTFGTDHPYYAEFDAGVAKVNLDQVRTGKGILVAARGEVDGGWATTATGIVSAQIFSDFLEMAEHLLAENYKDAAAVMIGSVLEEHVRQLCAKNGIPTDLNVNGKVIPKKADVMNADLTKAQVYGLLDQKMITAWLDLRNKAAHGKYAEYSKEQVELMDQGITQFIARNPL